MIPRILRRRVPVECAAPPRPAPHRTPDPDGTRPGTADAPATPHGRPRGADPGPLPISIDPSKPAPRDPIDDQLEDTATPSPPQNPSGKKCSMRLQVRGAP